MNNDSTAAVAPGDGFLELDLGVSKIFSSDMSEDVRCHHAQGFPANDLVTEGTGGVTKTIFLGVSSMM